jgi:hypothetical protein
MDMSETGTPDAYASSFTDTRKASNRTRPIQIEIERPEEEFRTR